MSSESIVIVDLENVGRLERVPRLENFDHLIVVVGAQQKEPASPVGVPCEYIKVRTVAKNNADFHIALKLGELATRYPSASFTICSADTGFDGICTYLREHKRSVTRVKPLAPVATPLTLQARIRLGSTAAKPKTRKKLLNWLASQLAISLDIANKVYCALIQGGEIKTQGERICYVG